MQGAVSNAVMGSRTLRIPRMSTKRLLRSLLICALILSWSTTSHAQSVVGGSTSTNSTKSGARQSFFDPVGGKHWQFWFNGTTIQYAFSSDGTRWTPGGTIASGTSNFAVTTKTIAGTSYMFLASEGNCSEESQSSSLSSSSSSTSSFSSSSSSESESSEDPYFSSSSESYGDGSSDSSYQDSSSSYDSDSSDSYYSGSSDSAYQNSSSSYYSGWSDSSYQDSTSSYYSGWSDSSYQDSTSSYYSGSSDSSYQDSTSSYYSGWSDSSYQDSTSSYYSGSSDSSYQDSTSSYYSGWSDSSYQDSSDPSGQTSSDGYYSSLGVTSFTDTHTLSLPNQRCEVRVARGTISGTSISFDPPTSAFEVGDSSSRWIKPSVAVDSAGHVWVAALNDVGLSAGDRYKVVATRSLSSGAQPLQFNAQQPVGRPLTSARALSILPLANQEMLIALTGEGSKENIVTYHFNGSAWGEITSSGEFGWSISAATGNMDVLAVARGPNGTLYVGGQFTSAGTTTATNVVMWDGTSWSALGSGVTGTSNSGQVQALAVDSQGNVYAGGWFTTAGGASANYIAKWDGNAWSPLGSGLNSSVNALAVDGNDDLYAGGTFSSAGGTYASYIAKWNGTSWSALGSGVNSSVRSLAVDGAGHLYVGGDFSTAGGLTASKVAKWTGSTWTNLGSGGNASVNGNVYSLAIDSNGNVYAGGAFTSAAGTPANRVAKWNGTSWSALGGGADGVVQSLTLDSSGNLYVGGAFTAAGGSAASRVAKWNGSSWTALGAGVSVTPNVVALDAQGALFVGASDGTSNANLLAWDGATWSYVVSGFDGAVRKIVFDSIGRIYAAGNFTKIGNVAANRIAMWDGTSWNPLGSGMTSSSGSISVATLAFDGAGNLYAAGTFTHAGGTAANNIAVWNGTSWSPVGSGTNGFISTIVFDRNGDLYAGGSFSTAGGISASRVAKWNGSSWSALGSGTGGSWTNYVFALAPTPNGDLFVGGYFTSAGGVTANNIAKWNGSAWSALGSGCSGYVRGLAVAQNGDLYATGSFITAGGITVNRVARWDGASWNPLGTGVSSTALGGALAIGSNGDLYAAGTFTSAGGNPANRIAVWNGTAWSSLGSGIPHPVFSVALHPSGAIYAGTSRSLAYGRPVTAADTGRSSVASLIPGTNGTAHLLYTDSHQDVKLTTLSGSPLAWSTPTTVHTGTVTSVTGTFYSATQKLVAWFIDGNEVLSTEAADPYTTWSPPSTISTTGIPRQISSYAEVSGYATLLVAWNRTGATLGEVVASTITMPTTPTPTMTPVSTATPTLTPIPTSTPTIPPPPPPSLAIGIPQGSPARGPVAVSEQSIAISGTGIPGHTIEIQVDGIVVGTALVRAKGDLSARSTSGVWEFNLPPLATGTREIVTITIDEVGNRSAPSAPIKLVVLDVAPLDFAGTGDSAIAAFRRIGDKMRFKTRTSSQSTWSTVDITGRYPAPADYDNDGVTDLAAVGIAGDKLQWNIKLSSTGKTSQEIVGSVGDTILSGCQFAADEGSALAAFNSDRRELVFSVYNNSTKRVVNLNKLTHGDLLGCGDTDGDGKDEILFRVRGVRKQSNSIAAFDTSGNRRLFTGYNQFLRGFVVRRAGTQIPLLAVLGGTTNTGRQVSITTMAGSFAFPLFYISRSATIGTGIFTNDANEQIPGIFWADNQSGMVYRRLLLKGSQTTALFKLPEAYKLIRSQNVIRTARPVKASPKGYKK